MAKIPLDFSFVRDGRALSAWLLDLVAEASLSLAPRPNYVVDWR